MYKGSSQQTAVYAGFMLPENHSAARVEKAELVLYGGADTGKSVPVVNVYGADYSEFNNTDVFNDSANIESKTGTPGYDSESVTSFTDALGENTVDVTDYIKGLESGTDAAFRFDTDSSNTWFTFGTNTNEYSENAPKLVITYTADSKDINQITAAERYDYTNDEQLAHPDTAGFIATVDCSGKTISKLTWYIKKANTEYKELCDGEIPIITNGTAMIGLIVYDLPKDINADDISAGYVVE